MHPPPETTQPAASPPDAASPQPAHRPTLVELREASKSFRAGSIESWAVSGVSLRVRQGDWLAITGPSGSGKSTLLSLMGLLDRPTRGCVVFGATDTTELRERARAAIRRHAIGFVFQSIHLAPRLTVHDNIALALTGRGLSRTQRRQTIERVLERVELTGRRDHHPAELSGGQQQRVAIARAIAVKPKLLLADEPTGNLDSRAGEAILTLLSSLYDEGTSVVLVTHDPRIAARAPWAIEMLDGRIIAERRDERIA
ncbi:MAG: ABC transporter ATP-binding protein [Phycisphaerales bacterium]